MTTTVRSAFTTRPYENRDEQEVLDLLRVSLVTGPAGPMSRDFFRWKHMRNPFGRSYMLVAEAGGSVVGLRAFMRWDFWVGDRRLRAVRAVDTTTHPAFQRLGMFRRLTLEAIHALKGEIDLVFNTPNTKSLPGYLKMGWNQVGRIPVYVRVRHPIRFAYLLPSLSRESLEEGPAPTIAAQTAAEFLRTALGLEELLKAVEVDTSQLTTPRTLGYLRWRYGGAPSLDYRAVCERDRQGRVVGFAIFRVRRRGRLWEATVAELIAPEHTSGTGRALLRRVAAAANVDHATCHFPRGSASKRAARAAGYLRSPTGMTFVVNPIRAGINPDPARMSSWALSLGDVEVF